MSHAASDMARLGTEPVGKLFRSMAVPAVMGQLAVLLNNFIDRLYVGHIGDCGGESLTAVGVSTPIMLIAVALATMVMGGTPLMSIFLGGGNREKAHRVVGSSLTFIVVTSILLTAVIFAAMPSLLALCGTSNDIMPYATSYLTLSTIGILPSNITIGMVLFISGQGMVKRSTMIIGTSVVSNMILDPILIFALGMGVGGAALATTISTTVAAAFLLRELFFKDNAIRLEARHLRIDWRLLGLCLSMSFQQFLAILCESAVGMLYNSSLARYGGDDAVGAMAVFYIINQIMMYLIMGLCFGMQPIISYSYGNHNFGRVRECARMLTLSCLGVCAVTWLVVLGFPKAVSGIFTDDAAVAGYAASYIRVFFATMVLAAIPYACGNILRFVRHVKEGIMLVVFRRILLSIPVILILPRLGMADPVTSVFLTAPVIDIVSGIVMLFYIFKTIHNIQNEEPSEHSHPNPAAAH